MRTALLANRGGDSLEYPGLEPFRMILARPGIGNPDCFQAMGTHINYIGISGTIPSFYLPPKMLDSTELLGMKMFSKAEPFILSNPRQ
jgi:hypothetical protein